MFTSFALLLPFCASVLGVFVFLCKRFKHVSQQLMLALDVLCLVYFLADSMLIDNNTSGVLSVVYSVLRQFIAPVLMPMILLFMRSFQRSNYYSWTTGFWFIFPVALGSVSVVLYALMGLETSEAYILQCNSTGGLSGALADDTICRLHLLFGRHIFTGVMFAEIVYVMVYLIHSMLHSEYTLRAMSKLLRTGGKVPVYNLLIPVMLALLLICVFCMGVGRSFLINHKLLVAFCNLLLASFVLLINYITLYANRSPITLRVLRSPLSGADGAKKYHYETDGDKTAAPVDGMSAIVYAELVDAFKALVLVDKVYLDSSLTLEDVAMRLHSNRTYVSCMISKEYGMNFRDYLSNLRVEYSQKFMKSNPAATQEEVAQASGFSGASTFNKKFHQIVGVSPRQWQVNN